DKLSKSTKWKAVIIKSTMISGFAFFLVTFLSIGILSQGVVADIRYPSFFVVQTITIADFFERFEVIIAILWYITIFFRLSLLLYIILEGLKGVFNLTSNQSLLLPICFISLFGAMSIWDDVTSLIEYLEVWRFYASLFGLLFPLLLICLGLFRKKALENKKGINQ
ncbi:GerAB/ArcD/ProY family transporter, partial [Alkalihalobacillus trypoxylicola]